MYVKNSCANRIKRGKTSVYARSRPVGTYRAAVEQGADVGVVIVRHLLVVGAQEAHGLVVVVLLLVVPGHRLVAVVRNVLPARGAQQPQESHLDHTDGVALRVHVRELRGGAGTDSGTEGCGGSVDQGVEQSEDP